MGTGFWSTGCRSDVEYFGTEGRGARYRSRFGTYDVTGGVYQVFASNGFECYVQPFLGAPVKQYGWVAEMNYGRGCYGQWFENCAIGYHDGRWNIMFGYYGQFNTTKEYAIPADAEVPPDPPIPMDDLLEETAAQLLSDINDTNDPTRKDEMEERAAQLLSDLNDLMFPGRDKASVGADGPE